MATVFPLLWLDSNCGKGKMQLPIRYGSKRTHSLRFRRFPFFFGRYLRMERTISRRNWKIEHPLITTVVHPTNGMVPTNTNPLWMFKHPAVMQKNGNGLDVRVDYRFQVPVKLNDNRTLRMIGRTHRNLHSLNNRIGLTVNGYIQSITFACWHLSHFGL